MSVHRASLHGLEIRSKLSFDGWPPRAQGPIDVVVEQANADDLPACEGSEPSASRAGPFPYTVRRTANGLHLEFPHIGQFSVTPSRVDVAAALEAKQPVLSLLLSGMVLSALLIARGDCALHASAVTRNGRTFALVGGSGSGKSTLAALLCARGAQLVSDDVLRVETTAGRPTCYAGTARLRLRERARVVSTLLPEWSTAETADGRLALMPPRAPPRSLALDAILLPSFDESARFPRLTRVRGAEAVARLLAVPRITGWRDPEVLQQFHRQLSALARSVPVLVASLPRMSFDETSATSLSSLVWGD